MSSFESYEEIDIVWNRPRSHLTAKNLYVIVQGETGFVPFILGAGIAGKNKNNCDILSKHMSVDVFNKFPEPVPPTWHITQFDKNNALMVITSLFPMVMSPDSNPDIWYKSYPMFKSVCRWLQSEGFCSMNFITMNNINEASEEPKLFVHDLTTKMTTPADSTMFLNLPAWSLPYLWNKMGGRAVITAATQDEGQFIDKSSLELLRLYVTALGVEYETEFADMAEETVRRVQSQIEMYEKGFSFGGDDEEGEWV